MAKLLLKTEIKRESGMLYFCATSKEGFITVNSAVMARGGRKKGSGKKKAVTKRTVTKKKR